MALDSYYAPVETITSPEQVQAKAAAVKLAADSTPEQNSGTKPKPDTANKPNLEQWGVSDLDLVDDTSGAAQKSNDAPSPPKSTAATDGNSAQPQDQPGTGTHTSDSGGVDNVVDDVGDGVKNEVETHKTRLLDDAVIGAGTAVVATVAVATAPVWGTALVTAAAAAGVGYAVDKLSKDVPGWIDDAKVAYDPSDYSQQQVQQSQKDLNHLGAGLADNAAGALGGVGLSTDGSMVDDLVTNTVDDGDRSADGNAARALDKKVNVQSDPPNETPPEQNKEPQESNQDTQNKPPGESTEKSDTDKSQPDADSPLPSKEPVITDSQNPANYIRQSEGAQGEQAAQAYEMARKLLGDKVQGIAGSYARGEARPGQWPVKTYDEALGLDKMPEELPGVAVEQLPADAKAIYNLKQQLGTVPSDLDVVVAGSRNADLSGVAKQIFDSTGVLVEFCSP
ncbi:MAG TPA: hypothetical protein V6C81_06935 [Planktothrix sp.]